MNNWLLNIVGVIFIGVLLDIILPDGKTNSFIKHIFTIFLLFVIISPISSLVNKNFTLNTNKNVIDENFIYNTNLKKVEELEKLIKQNLDDVGIQNTSVIINASIFEENLTINSVYVDITNKVLTIDAKKLNVKEEVIKVVVNTVKVNKEDIVIYG